jgi:hypothetical protein
VLTKPSSGTGNRTMIAMVRKRTTPKGRTSFEKARSRALGRLREGLDLRWTPPIPRGELHRSAAIRPGTVRRQDVL